MSGRDSPAREPLLVVALVLAVAVVALISSLGAPLIPEIAAENGVPIASAQWSLTLTLLVGAVATPVVGRLGDGRHRRRTMITILVLTGCGCAIAALPLGFPGLLAGRALQGTGLGLPPLAMAVARDHLAPERLRRTVALLSVTTIAGAGVGYPISGALSLWGGVSASFWFGVVVCAVAGGLAIVVVPRGGPVADVRLDIVGAITIGSALAAFLLAVSQTHVWPWGTPMNVGLLGAAIVLAMMWGRRALRIAAPLIDLTLMRRRRVMVANVTALVAGVGIYLQMSNVSRILQTPPDVSGGLGTSVFVAACAMAPFAATALVTAQTAPRLARSMDSAWLLPIGCVLFALAMVQFLFLRHEVWMVFVTMALCGLGAGCTFAAMPGLIIRAVPADRVGSAIGFNQVIRTVGYSIGSAASAGVLALFTAAGGYYPDPRGYSAAALAGVAVFTAGAVLTAAMVRRA